MATVPSFIAVRPHDVGTATAEHFERHPKHARFIGSFVVVSYSASEPWASPAGHVRARWVSAAKKNLTDMGKIHEPRYHLDATNDGYAAHSLRREETIPNGVDRARSTLAKESQLTQTFITSRLERRRGVAHRS